MVGQKAQEQFDSIINSVVQSDWSVDLSSCGDNEGVAMYVTWGVSSNQGVGDSVSAQFGQPLGRLASQGMRDMVAKGIVAYGE